VNQFLASKNPRAHSSNLVCANRQGDLVIFVRGADLASRQGAGPQMVGGALINASRRHRRELIVLTLPPRYHRPLHQLPASRLLPPRSGLERSDFVLWRFDDIVVEPAPYQRPHPPVWLAASSANSITLCARRGYNLLLDQFASPEQIGERIGLYRQELEAAGHAYDPMRVAVARNCWVALDAADRDEAIGRQAQVHERLLALSRGSESRPASHILAYSDTAGAREAHSLIGSSAEIAAKLTALKAQGVAYVLLFGQGSRENMRRFAETVMPGFAAE
jgi:alkanesulfonate monooxygenase SsuD/methylene tetrahydromethanopterin reductase-like flavin-dependent oxidoreductase (luciferase family)